jgi:hypothetical protein
MAQDRGKRLDHHDARVSAKKNAGWQQTRNGSYVQPVGDPRYPGASPSGGAGVMTKDDMDSESFKPAAMVNPGYREEFARETRTVVRYEPYPQMTDTHDVYVPTTDSDVYVDHGSVYSQEPSTESPHH